MDFVTNLPITPAGNDSIWVVVDACLSSFIWKACKKTISAEGTSKLYERAVFRHHGVPKSIVSDRDFRFVSDFWQSISKRLNTELFMSTKNHPQSDDQTKHANSVMKDTLRHFVGPYQKYWEELLPVVEFSMNNSFNSAIQNTPFMLTYGQHPDDHASAWLRHRNAAVDYVRWSEQLARARKHIAVAQQRMEQNADKHRRPAPEFKPGDEVSAQCQVLQAT